MVQLQNPGLSLDPLVGEPLGDEGVVVCVASDALEHGSGSKPVDPLDTVLLLAPTSDSGSIRAVALEGLDDAVPIGLRRDPVFGFGERLVEFGVKGF